MTADFPELKTAGGLIGTSVSVVFLFAIAIANLFLLGGVYRAFCRVKHLFDPKYLFNPGKVVAAEPMTESLRYGDGYDPVPPETVFDYERQGGFVRAVEQCNGNGVCLKTAATMCPTYIVTHEESRDMVRRRFERIDHAYNE